MGSVIQEGIGAWLADSQNTWRDGAIIWAVRASASGRPISSILGDVNRWDMEDEEESLLLSSLLDWESADVDDGKEFFKLFPWSSFNAELFGMVNATVSWIKTKPKRSRGSRCCDCIITSLVI